MNKSYLTVNVFLLSLFLQSTAHASCITPTLPSELKLSEKLISLTTSLNLKANDVKLGSIDENFFSLVTTFTYNDANHQKIAVAHDKFISWGNDIIVNDCEGNKIGEIKEEILKSLFKVYTTYSILDEKENILGTSEKVDWIGTHFTLFDKNKKIIAELSRPFINFLTDEWTIKIAKPGVIDNRILVMIGAFKTHADNERRREQKQR